MPNTQSMEERFNERYHRIKGVCANCALGEDCVYKSILAFITSERELWKREMVEGLKSLKDGMYEGDKELLTKFINSLN